MYLCRVTICFFFCLEIVNCSIVSLNNKYSNKHVLFSIKTRSKDNLFDPLEEPVSGLLRHRRDTQSNHSAQADDSGAAVTFNRVVLNGTEKSSQAYIHWTGKETSERIFILTCRQDFTSKSRILEESQLWRSDDYGTSFHRPKLDPEAKISYFYSISQNPKKLLFTDTQANKIYVTENELDTWEVHNVPVEPDQLLLHPTDENKLLLYSMSHSKLYVSTNFATDWTLLAENILPNFYWGSKDYDISPDVVHMEMKGEIPYQATYKACIIPDCTNATDGSVGPFLAGTLIVHKEYMFVQKTNMNGSDSYLAVSYKREPFKRAFFPTDLKTDDFIILNLDDGQVFVAVNHRGIVNLYLSNAAGQYFVQSFASVYNIIRPTWFEIDFYEVQGMLWTFLVNKKESGTVRTYISYDKGGNWKPLMLNQSCAVVEQCSLLLQVQVSYAVSVFSQENAPGIIMAHGSIGTKPTGQQINVFTSNDGGGTWHKAVLDNGTALTGYFRFNILDQGTILTAIVDGWLTSSNSNMVYYSVDQGVHWKVQDFDHKGFRVEGYLTEPGLSTMVASVFGHEPSKDKSQDKPWIAVKLNFSRALTRKCEDKDYLPPWSPRDYNNPNVSNCILGQVLKYNRPTANATCYNGKTVTKTVENETCLCTSEDFECDYGYEKSSDGCKKAQWFDETNFQLPECDSGGTYKKSKGYRKIPADNCNETNLDKSKYDPVITNCTSAKPAGLSIVAESLKLLVGKSVNFHLEQTGGSKFDTNYTWNFGDKTPAENIIGIRNAFVKSHIYHLSGRFNITVTAENSKGKAVAVLEVHIQDSLTDLHLISPWAGKTRMPINFNIYVTYLVKVLETESDKVHFVWIFGDEKPDSQPILTWKTAISHTYDQAGAYKVSVEAVNSVSTVYKEFTVEIFDNVEILELTFSDNISKIFANPYMGEVLTLRLRQQLAEDIGVNIDQVEAVQATNLSSKCLLYIISSNRPGETSIIDIKKQVIQLVQEGNVKINVYGDTFGPGSLFPVIAVKELEAEELGTGPNMKAVYIAVPVLVLAVLVSGASFMYCKKKMRNNRQYNILNAQDDSDALLDDDEPPLDLNVDFGARTSSRDDTMLDSASDIPDYNLSGGSHLVMVTGGGSSDNAENC